MVLCPCERPLKTQQNRGGSTACIHSTPSRALHSPFEPPQRHDNRRAGEYGRSIPLKEPLVDLVTVAQNYFDEETTMHKRSVLLTASLSLASCAVCFTTLRAADSAPATQ